MRFCNRCGIDTMNPDLCMDCLEVEGFKRPTRRLATLPDPEFDPPFPIPWSPSENRVIQGERDVAIWVEWNKNYTSSQIAMMFGINRKTVRNHLRRMKLGVYAEG